MSLTAEHLAPRDSPLARRDPRWRLAGFAIAIFAVAVTAVVGAAGFRSSRRRY